MNPRSVDAGHGLAWFKGGIGLVQANPVPLLVIALLFVIGTSALSLVPVLGTLAVALLVPVLGGGYMVALHEEHEGRGAQIEHLFRGFQDNDRLVQLIILGVPAVLAGLLFVVLLVALLGAAVIKVGITGLLGTGDGVNPAALGVGAMVLVLLGLLVLLLAMALVVFAVPRVMLDRVDAVTAMKESFAASLSSMLALLVFALMFLAAFVVLVVATVAVGWIPILGQIAAFFAWVAFGIGWIAVSNAGVYLAWRDLWPADAAAAAGPLAPPPLPPAPPAT
jgi:hypothetical protein